MGIKYFTENLKKGLKDMNISVYACLTSSCLEISAKDSIKNFQRRKSQNSSVTSVISVTGMEIIQVVSKTSLSL